ELEYYIKVNHLKAHDKLPSERELSELFNINRSTLRAAILRMIDEGKLYKATGSGNFVQEPKIVRNLNDLDSLTELVKRFGKEISSQVIHASVIEANKQIMKKLKLTLGTKVFQLLRVRLIDNEPFALETSLIEYQRFEGIEKYDFEKVSLYKTLKDVYGVDIVKGQEKLTLTYATEEEAELLSITYESPLFFISGTAEDKEDRPVEYFRSVVRPDKMKFSSILVKKSQEETQRG
ncbi:MAG: GntR family transcriptional regulator, partial [Bacillota bacterium]